MLARIFIKAKNPIKLHTRAQTPPQVARLESQQSTETQTGCCFGSTKVKGFLWHTLELVGE